jgi:hypothetical protein
MSDESAGALRRKVGGTKARPLCEVGTRTRVGHHTHTTRAARAPFHAPSTHACALTCRAVRPLRAPLHCARAQSGFFGESVDVKGKYVEQGYVSSRPTEVPYIPVLIVVGAHARADRFCDALARMDVCADADADAWLFVCVVLGIVAATVAVVAKAG